MKLKSIFAGAAAALVLGSFAQAQSTTTIRITGSSAFRESAHNAIKNAFSSVNYAYTGTSLTSANQAIFVAPPGTLAGIGAGVTLVIKTSWSGSVEGLRDVANNGTATVSYLANGQTVSSGGTSGATTLVSETGAKVAFSDVSKNASPYASLSWTGDKVAVLVFAPVATSNLGDNQNVTQKQFQALFRNGFAPKSFITGLSADAGSYVFATGRNDGSGTRTVYAAESGLGDSDLAKSYRLNALQQWRIEGAADTTHSAVRLWPLADGANASIIWNGDVFEGNGGYSSGGTLRSLLDDAFASTVNAQGPDGSTAFTISAPNTVSMLTVLGATDAAVSITGGAKLLSWNGTKITPQTAANGGLNAADRLKVAYGLYTLWSYEYLYARGLDANETVFFNKLSTDTKTKANIGGNGISLGEMFVERVEEGAQVTFIP